MRAELRKVVSRLGEGDVLMVTRLDRLARSTRDLLNTLDEIAKRGAGFKSLADPQSELYRALTTMAHHHAKDLVGGAARHEDSRQYERGDRGPAKGSRPAGSLFGGDRQNRLAGPA
jgi:DNA invertase Pin-like site-specific DNA recombinase